MRSRRAGTSLCVVEPRSRTASARSGLAAFAKGLTPTETSSTSPASSADDTARGVGVGGAAWRWAGGVSVGGRGMGWIRVGSGYWAKGSWGVGMVYSLYGQEFSVLSGEVLGAEIKAEAFPFL